MAFKTAPLGTHYNGWYRDDVNSVLEWYHNSTKVGQASGATTTFSGTVTSTGAMTANVTGFVSTTGNLKMGTAGTFGTTQPQAAVVMGGSSLTGIAPVGAITTAGAIFASDTVVMKIVAAGTANNVET